jgi:uncharacterized protein (TIGR03118 family)
MPPLSPPTLLESSSSAPPSAKPRGSRRRGRVALATVAAVTLALVGASGPAVAHDRHKGHHEDNAFKQVNLVSDIDKLAQIHDVNVVNPWGIDFGPQTPLWVSNQGSNTLTLYRGGTKAMPVAQKVPLTITANSPTGMLFNPTKKFQVPTKNGMAPANFLMNENLFTQTSATGQVTAWSNAFADTSKTLVKANKANSFYSGLTMLPPTHKRGPRLLVANNITGNIDIFDGNFRPRSFGSKAFKDPKVAALKALPYNVAYLKGRVYVAYAPPFGEPGTPALTVFDTHGRFIKRLVTGGSLNNPWGMTIAPKHWGKFGGALLVGNVNDGMIHAFDPRTGHLRGTLKDKKGKPLVNIGLWGLKFGNGVIGTPRTLIFAAGIGNRTDDFEHGYEHGLVGAITPVHDDDDDDDDDGGGHY